MRSWLLISLLGSSLTMWCQNSNPPPPSNPAKNPPPPPSASSSAPVSNPNLEAPRSDRINIRDLDDAGPGESSSKDTQVDLSPPPDEAKADASKSGHSKDDSEADVSEFHPWDPHRAAKDIEVGDFYFKRKNYAAAENRYREALYYKDNDAMATYGLAVCLDRLDRLDEAREQYESYLKILPHGAKAEEVKKALDRLRSPAANPKAAK